MKNILITESKNDQYFVEALAKKVNEGNETRCIIDEFVHSSIDETRLTTQITSAIGDLIAVGDGKLGIILDIDAETAEMRIELINRCLSKTLKGLDFPETKTLLKETNKFIKLELDESTVEIACFFTNINGEGELETVLKAIKSKPSPFADCLEDGWKECLKKKDKKMAKKGQPGDFTDKELLKLWVDFYKKFDTLKILQNEETTIDFTNKELHKLWLDFDKKFEGLKKGLNNGDGFDYSEEDLRTLWLDFYKRFDTLKKSDRDDKNTSWRGIMLGVTEDGKKLKEIRGEKIFDLNHHLLDDLKAFLKMFD